MSRVQISTQGRTGLELQIRSRGARIASRLRHWQITQGYSFVLVLVAPVVACRWWLDPILHDTLPFALFVPGILIAGWRTGSGPSLFAAALGLISGLWFLFDGTHGTANFGLADCLEAGTYILTALTICWFAETSRQSKERTVSEAAEVTAKHCRIIEAREQGIQELTSEVERLKHQLQEENNYLREQVRVSQDHHRIVGQSAALQQVLIQAEQVARTDATVLVLGETGTGKELLAEFIHGLSARQGRPLVSVNCAAMPVALVESELFGREKGAFTGSLSRQIGRFELADHSTVFLDEVGELSLEVQAKLLRALEAGQIERLGNPKPVNVDVRIIAATNRNLEQAVAEGKFRQDLFYRLNVFPIKVPPLRSRTEDIPLLVWAFVDEFAKRFNRNIESIDRGCMASLQTYPWPGNIRELRNLIERAMIVANGPKLRIQLPAAASALSTHPQNLEEVERGHVLRVLDDTGWRVRGINGAAAKLGLKPTTLEARMARLGIRRPGSTVGPG